jgi:predicted membrane protein
MSTAPSYLNERLEKQLNWHSTRASHNKNKFYAVEVITLIAGALIPVINIVELPPTQQFWQRMGSALLAAIIVVTTGIGKLFKFQENWLTYRGLTEELEREKELYLNRVWQYAAASEEDRQKLLVERTESILSTTTSRFVSLHRAEREESVGAEKS